MNKKLLGVIGLSGALMFGSVYSISAGTSGYDLYKDALKKTHQLDSTTMQISMELNDNNNQFFSADSIIKTDRLAKTMEGSTNLSNGTVSSSYEIFRQDGHFFVKKNSENMVYSMKSDGSHHGANTNRKELQDDMEKLVDVLTKNLQQKVTVEENKNGTKEVNLKLTSTEIPVSANIVASLMLKHGAMMNDRVEEKESSFHDVKMILPELKTDIVIKEVNIVAKISTANFVEEQDIAFWVTGKDETGKTHELNLNFSLDLVNPNNTNVKQLDVTNIQIQELKHGHSRK